jgi:hypothetical protein
MSSNEQYRFVEIIEEKQRSRVTFDEVPVGAYFQDTYATKYVWRKLNNVQTGANNSVLAPTRVTDYPFGYQGRWMPGYDVFYPLDKETEIKVRERVIDRINELTTLYIAGTPAMEAPDYQALVQLMKNYGLEVTA